jgi:prophage regulatory protein
MSRLIRLPQVLEATGLSRSSIHRMEAAGQFPRRRQVGTRAVAWDVGEIDAWISATKQVQVSCADAPRVPDKP